MNSPARNARPLRARAIAFAISYLLLLAPLAAPAAHAGVRQRKTKPPAPARIEVALKDSGAVLRPNQGVTFVARVFAKNGALIEGGEVRWSATGSNAVGLTTAVNEGTRHEVTLIGFKPGGRTPAAALVEVTATLGTLKDSESVSFQPNVVITLRPASGAPPKFGPGEKYTLVATVSDGTTDIANAAVDWSLADDQKGDFVQLVIDRAKPNEVEAIGLKPKGTAKPGDIIVAATYGGIPKFASVPYEGGDQTGGDKPKPPDNTSAVKDIVVEITGEASSSARKGEYDIEAGQRLALTAKVEKPEGDSKDPPEPIWSVPQDMAKYIAMLPQSKDEKKKGQAVFFGLTPEPGEEDALRETLYVLVQAKDFVKAVPIRHGEQTVDVSWNIMPPDLVTKNYGRSISDKFYGVEVVIGNNSGNDLQLSGLSFEINKDLLRPEVVESVPRRVSVASYGFVRGVTEQRKLSLKSRGTILGVLDATAQILTGFTPYFHVATRARNFSQGINILGNPVTKGIERVWPDPSQDELSRLEEQSLHDDKIIPDDSVHRTTVFVPRDLLTRQTASLWKDPNNGGNENDPLLIRQRLGQLVLVGTKLNRNDFRLRVRQGSQRASDGSNR